MANDPEHIHLCKLGRVAYGPTWDLQGRLQQRLIDAKRADPPEHLAHLLLFVEHPPVYTLGKNGSKDNLLASDTRLKERGATFYEIDRGGDITYHGPGQLVGYPILDLDRFFTDVHRYLRTLEEVIIRTCAEYGVSCFRIEGRTGVWTGKRGQERKICAMGIRCSRWVTMHGFAFNITTDLSYFSHIVPCGINDRDVTSLDHELDHSVDESEVARRVAHHFADRFEANLNPHPPAAVEKVFRSYDNEAADLLTQARPSTHPH
jgi:lipoyl(octanoyl) transferase